MLSDSNFILYNSIDSRFREGLQMHQIFFLFPENGINFDIFAHIKSI
jgi:hypothetical protein